jgi:hypothetical protein
MEYMSAIQFALKAKAPVVAIPVADRVPVFIRTKLLKGALKGVTIDSVKLLENGWIKIEGRAKGDGNSIPVRTCSTFAPMDRNPALRLIGKWSIKEREKRIKVINQGVLSASEQRALKLKAAEQAGIAELIRAQKDVEEIYREAREHVNPPMVYSSEEDRPDTLAEYSDFRKHRHVRKYGAVIRWKIDKLKETLASITVIKGKRHERKRRYARKAADAPKMLLIMRQITALEAEFETVYPPKWRSWGGDPKNGMYWDSWTEKHPTKQTCSRAYSWRSEDSYDRQALARRLREAISDIRALTPPQDETEEMPIAA